MTAVSWQRSELTSLVQDDIYAFMEAQDDIYAFRKAQDDKYASRKAQDDFMHSGKSIFASPLSQKFSQLLPLKQCQCWSD